MIKTCVAYDDDVSLLLLLLLFYTSKYNGTIIIFTTGPNDITRSYPFNLNPMENRSAQQHLSDPRSTGADTLKYSVCYYVRHNNITVSPCFVLADSHKPFSRTQTRTININNDIRNIYISRRSNFRLPLVPLVFLISVCRRPPPCLTLFFFFFFP